MKSITILASALLIACTTAVTAQTKVEKTNVEKTPSKSIKFGIKGGANFSSVDGGAYTPDYRFNFHAGLLTELPVCDKFSFQVEALYSVQGYKVNFAGADHEKAQFEYDYINVPVLARIYVLKCVSIDAGPQISFLVNDKYDLSPNPDMGNVHLDTTDPNKYDLGIAGGLTFQSEMGFLLNARYTYGVTKVYDTSNGRDIAFDGLHNQVFQASLGYRF